MFLTAVHLQAAQTTSIAPAAKPQQPFRVRNSSTTNTLPSVCASIPQGSSLPPQGYTTQSMPTISSTTQHISTVDTDGPTQAPAGLSLKQVKTLLNNPTTPLSAKVSLISQHNTALDGTSMKITPKTKNRPTATGRGLSQGAQCSFTQSKRTFNSASISFPDTATQAAYDAFMTSLQNTPTFIPLFRKLHIVALHQIYLYLVGIYTALTMTHIDDVKTYIATEQQYALNKKTLIIMHLVNLIQAQLNSALQALFPGIPEQYAIKSGMAALEQDTGSNLDTLVINLEQAVMAVMGISTLSVQQVAVTINELTAHLPGGTATPTFSDATLTQALRQETLQGSATVADLQAALAVMNAQGVNFISNLSAEQTRSLVGAFSILLATYAHTQTTANLKAFLQALTNKAAPLTTQQFNDVQMLIGQLCTGQQLTNEITVTQTIAKALSTKSATPFTQDQITALQGIVGYVLQNYEEQSLEGITSIVKQLGSLNPQAQVISVLDALTLKSIAQQVLGLNNQPSLPLAALPDKDRFLLAYGLTVLAQQQNNQPISSTLLQLAQLLNNAPLSQSELTSSQAQALTTALTQLANYQMVPLNAQDVGSSFSQQQTTIAQSALAKINAPGFTSFTTLTPDEQQAALKLFQEMSRVMETRLVTHRQQSTLLTDLFAGNPQLQKALFSSMSADQYQALSALDKQLIAGKPFSAQQLTSQQVTTPDGVTLSLSLADALAPLFEEKTTNATPSYYSILIQIQQQFFSDPALQQVIQQLSPQDIQRFQQVVKQFTNPNFSFYTLDNATKSSLTKAITLYLQQMSVPTNQKKTAPIAFANSTQEAVNIVSNTLFYTHVFTTGQSTFLATLQKYLTFFNLYTGTLQSAAQPSYAGLTVFENLARQLSTQLQGTPTESLNPPLFFFNDATFKGLRIIPKLAQMVDGTQRAPYPTFSIELAVKGSALDPSSGQTYQNVQTTGPLTYNKFFFLDPSQSNPTLQQQIQQGLAPAPELTGLLPSWVSKIPVPTANPQSYPYIYTANQELPGITGFYMNIPTFEPDPNNKNGTLIRLYEQPIIAQPSWLSVSGWPTATQKISSSESVLTIVRGCLGDFQSLLPLNIFDPCLTVIFTKALALANQSTQNEALTQACSNYISEKLADQERQTTVQATISSNTASLISGQVSSQGTP